MNFRFDLHLQISNSFQEQSTFPTCLSTLYKHVHTLNYTSLEANDQSKKEREKQMIIFEILKSFQISK